MSKAIKVWLIVAAILVMVGALIFAVGMAALDFDFSQLGTHEYETNTYTVSEDFDKISIHVTTPEVIFAVSDNGKCKVVCYEEEKLKHSVTVQDGTLVIGTVDTRKWYDHIGISFETMKMTVYLPQSAYTSLSVHTDTGDVEIPRDFTFARISVDSSTGDVRCYGLANDLTVRTSTGEIELHHISCKNVNVKSSTGDVNLINVVASQELRAETSTGDVELKNCDAASIFLKTSTGDVEGTLLTGKIFLTETSTGDVRVPNTTTGGQCVITTATGDIEIEIA